MNVCQECVISLARVARPFPLSSSQNQSPSRSPRWSWQVRMAWMAPLLQNGLQVVMRYVGAVCSLVWVFWVVVFNITATQSACSVWWSEQCSLFHVALVTKFLECGISMAVLLEGSGVWGLAMCFDVVGFVQHQHYTWSCGWDDCPVVTL